MNGTFFCRENIKWNFFTHECVKKGVNVKLEIFLCEFVNLDLCVNITRIFDLQVCLRNLFKISRK